MDTRKFLRLAAFTVALLSMVIIGLPPIEATRVSEAGPPADSAQ
jgi:hypothetical protein